MAEKVQARSAAADYFRLTKPELTGLSVLTSLCGFYLAVPTFAWIPFATTGIATFMIGGGLGALNQVAEHVYDGAMKRTERRPIPARRIPESTALVLGLALVGGGLVLLHAATHALAALLGAVTVVFYLLAYTPLKRSTWIATLVGSVPGALPPLIGWAAGAGEVSAGGWILFGILFLWQIPHFLSLAWMYKTDYARAGFRTLPVSDASGRKTGLVIVLHTAALTLVSLGLWTADVAGAIYAAGALVLGLAFFGTGVQFLSFARTPREGRSVNVLARKVFFASLFYLPLLMLLMILDKLPMH